MESGTRVEDRSSVPTGIIQRRTKTTWGLGLFPGEVTGVAIG